MYKLTFLLLSIIAFSCKNNPIGYSITSLTTNISDSTLVFLNAFTDDFDSTYIIGNKFKFTGKIDEPHKIYLIYIYTDKGYLEHSNRSTGFKEYTFFWLANEAITFDARNTSFEKAKINGSKLQNQSDEYESVLAYYTGQMDSLRSIMRKLSPEDSTYKREIGKMRQSLRKKKEEKGIMFVKEHPVYELSAYLLTFLMNSIDKEMVKKIYDGLDEKVQNTEWGNTISIYIEKSVKLKVGDKAVDFSLPDIYGNEVTLSSFSGKYVLLEFWATYCAPCRWENPNLLKAYKKHKEHGFEILGVSLDGNRSHWESTVKKDSIIWTTVSDLKGMSGVVPITYNVYYIPNNYLLDKEGIVIAKDLRGDKLSEKLKEILGE